VEAKKRGVPAFKRERERKVRVIMR